jgi:hypothetical protein
MSEDEDRGRRVSAHPPAGARYSALASQIFLAAPTVIDATAMGLVRNIPILLGPWAATAIFFGGVRGSAIAVVFGVILGALALLSWAAAPSRQIVIDREKQELIIQHSGYRRLQNERIAFAQIKRLAAEDTGLGTSYDLLNLILELGDGSVYLVSIVADEPHRIRELEDLLKVQDHDE